MSQEDSLEEEMATHSNILAWEIPWTEKPGGATVHGITKESVITERLNNNSNNIMNWTLFWSLEMKQ